MIRPSTESCSGFGSPPVPGSGPWFITTSGKRTPERPEKKSDIPNTPTALSVYILA